MLSVQVLENAVLVAEASELGLLRRGSSCIVDGGQTPDSSCGGTSRNRKSIGHGHGGSTGPASGSISHGEHFA